MLKPILFYKLGEKEKKHTLIHPCAQTHTCPNIGSVRAVYAHSMTDGSFITWPDSEIEKGKL